jgi:hypothetical protein
MQRNKEIYLVQGGYGNRLIIYSHIKNIQNNSENNVSIIFHKRCNASTIEPIETINLSCPVNRKIDFFAYYLSVMFNRIGLNKFYLKYFEFIFGKIHIGYFQDKKFFSHELSKFNSHSRQDYSNPYSSEAVFIHIRRGDYYTDRFIKQYGGICTVDYYKNALNQLKEKKSVNEQSIVIISDDPSWVSENINFKNMVIHKSNSYLEDWCLMKNAKNLIISNSTFSLTAAWAGNVNNVFYPSKWDNFTNNKENKLFKTTWNKVKIQ